MSVLIFCYLISLQIVTVESANKKKLKKPNHSQFHDKHSKARFSVSTGVKIENFIKVKTENKTKQIIEVNYIEYFIENFAFK